MAATAARADDIVVLEADRVRKELRTKQTQVTRRYRPGLCGLRKEGLAPPRYWELHDIVVGYDHSWDDGPRRRCEHGVSRFYQSILRYDLEPIAGREVISAALHVEDASIADADPDRDAEGCYATAGRIGMVSRPQRTIGDGEVQVDALTPHVEGILRNVVGNVRPDLSGSEWELDITEWVRGWLDGSIANNGIALEPWSTRSRHHERVCVGTVLRADIVARVD